MYVSNFFFNKQIERWWKELHERLEKYFKEQLAGLKGEGYYNPHDEVDRYNFYVLRKGIYLLN